MRENRSARSAPGERAKAGWPSDRYTRREGQRLQGHVEEIDHLFEALPSTHDHRSGSNDHRHHSDDHRTEDSRQGDDRGFSRHHGENVQTL